MKKAHIIVIGNEILSGSTIDTNSNYIANELKKIGVLLAKITVIPDEINLIIKHLEQSCEYDLVITTGGLGPTNDDKTKLAWSSFFKEKLVLNLDVLQHLTDYFKKKGRLEILERNKEQAMVLENCQVLQNDLGTAPCMCMQKENQLFFCLPGVPYELKNLVRNKIIPNLKEKWSLNYHISRAISVVNIPESMLAERLTNWENSLSSAISLSYLPIGTRVKLVLSISGSEKIVLEDILEKEIIKLDQLIGDNIIAKNHEKIEQILGEVLKEKNLSISVAESCTIGQISNLIASISGSSSYFKGGIVSYSSETKEQVLKISTEILKNNSIVSEAVALEMAKKCKLLFNTDISIATTGVAGPNLGEDHTEVGQIYVGIVTPNIEKVFHFNLPHLERMDFVNFTSQKSIENLVVMLTKFG